MSGTRNGAIIAIAAAALVASAQIPMATQAQAADVKCYGINSCAGHGAGGGNSCRGQGITVTTAANCKAKGGKIVG